MTIQDLGSIGELIAALATIATLIYLAIQIRQNTNMAQTQYVSSSIENLRPFQLWRAESAEKARIYRKGLTDLDSISIDERMMLDGLLHMQLMQFADSRVAHEKGILADEFFDGLKIYVASILNMPGAAAWWAENKTFYSTTGLDALLDAQMKTTPSYREIAPSVWKDN